MENNSQVVSVGEVLQKIAWDIAYDLRNVVDNMPNQNPELNTTQLQLHINRAKKKLLQTLALVRWLSQERVVTLFQALDRFNFDMGMVEGRYGRLLHEMFMLHSSIYSMKVPTPKVEAAYRILCQQRHDTLPTAIFSCGQKSFPKDPSPSILSALRSKLDIIVRMKLKLCNSKSIFQPPLSAKLKTGLLGLTYHGLFKAAISLYSINNQSDWRILSLSVDSYGKEDDVFAAERKLARNKSIASCLKQYHEQHHSQSLNTVIYILYHFALLERLRDLSVSISRVSKLPLYENKLESRELQTTSTNDLLLTLRLWKSEFLRDFIFTVDISSPLLAAADSNNQQQPLLHLQLKANSISNSISLAAIQVRFERELVAGTTSEELLSMIIVHMTTAKLQYLDDRLLHTISSSTAADCNVTHSSFSMLQLTSNGLTLHIGIDSFTGRFFIAEFANTTTVIPDVIARFVEEINSVESERLSTQFILDHNTKNHLLVKLDTLTLLLAYGRVLSGATHFAAKYAAVSADENRYLQGAFFSSAFVARFWRCQYWTHRATTTLTEAERPGGETLSVISDMNKSMTSKSTVKRIRRDNNNKEGVVRCTVLYLGLLVKTDDKLATVGALATVGVDSRGKVVQFTVTRRKEFLSTSDNLSTNAVLAEANSWVIASNDQHFQPVSLIPMLTLTAPTSSSTASAAAATLTTLFAFNTINLSLYTHASMFRMDKEITVIAVEEHIIDIFFLSASSLLAILAIKTPNEDDDMSMVVGEIISSSKAVASTSKCIASLRLQSIHQRQQQQSSNTNIIMSVQLESVSLFNQVTSSDPDAIHAKLSQQFQQILHFLLRQVSWSQGEDQIGRDLLHGVVVTARAVLVLLMAAATGVDQVRSGWFVNRDLRLVGISEDSGQLCLSFACDQLDSTGDKGEVRKQTVNYMTATLDIASAVANQFQTIPQIQFEDIKTGKQMAMDVTQLSLAAALEFYNSSVFDDST